MLRIANFFARWTLLFQGLKKSRVLVFLVHTVNSLFKGWGLVRRFTFASTIVVILGMIGIGRWVGEEIKAGVIKEATAATALYMDSFIAPNVQELNYSDAITPENIANLNNLFSENNLGQRTVSIKVWNLDHRIAYSNIPALIGRKFPDTTDLVDSMGGLVTGEISSLKEAENIEERRLSSDPLLEIYSPVRLNGTNQIIAVAEFYQRVDTLQTTIIEAQRRGWVIVGATMSIVYLLLVGFVVWANNRIGKQELELKDQVKRLTQLLSHNKDLSEQVRLAAANTASLNESLLRRTSAELHDGPVQDIGLVLLRLDNAIAEDESGRFIEPISKLPVDLPVVQTSLQSALRDMRSIASGLGLPQLDDLTLADVARHVVHAHEQRTRTKVDLTIGSLPEQVDLPIKITTYRFIQEGLTNAYRHANGVGQSVQVLFKLSQLQIEISDQGPGFPEKLVDEIENRLGLAGMRDRIESLGGVFTIDNNTEKGARLIARLPLLK